jgi:uncharacterized protein DUF3145
VTVRGVLHVHSAPPALSPHVEWAVAGVLGVPVSMPWVNQPAAPGMLRAELDWEGHVGMAGEITSALAGWNRLRFEVTEEASPGCDALRFSYTPALGVFSAVTMANGDVLVPESRLRQAMTVAAAAPSSIARLAHSGGAADGRGGAGALEQELSRLLGEPWDCELEPFRCAADGAPVRWLHATG